mmetsp:Transcript_62422/g.125044  ORF Transcript_62422/g.125044 Transcript_62422/m.125044 type:complete len:231 (-) Transcript_62422:140-832(-)
MMMVWTMLILLGSTYVSGEHTQQGKDVWFHDGHLRYGAAQPLAEGSCGLPMWTVVKPESQVPDRAFVAAHDTRLCDGTVCGKDIYVSMVAGVNGGVSVGKTWFTRTDGMCASLAYAGEGMGAGEECRVLTMGSSTHGASRFEWAPVEAFGNSGEGTLGYNRFVAPKNAMVAGNDPVDHGPIYVCRFLDDHGEYLVGQTWFPRHDEACCSAEFGGGEARGQQCEILVKKAC